MTAQAIPGATFVVSPYPVGYKSGLHGDGWPDERGWWTRCPVCGKNGLLRAHEVTFPYDDEAGHPRVTITPSCACQCGAHWTVTSDEVRILEAVPTMGGPS